MQQMSENPSKNGVKIIEKNSFVSLRIQRNNSRQTSKMAVDGCDRLKTVGPRLMQLLKTGSCEVRCPASCACLSGAEAGFLGPRSWSPVAPSVGPTLLSLLVNSTHFSSPQNPSIRTTENEGGGTEVGRGRGNECSKSSNLKFKRSTERKYYSNVGRNMLSGRDRTKSVVGRNPYFDEDEMEGLIQERQGVENDKYFSNNEGDALAGAGEGFATIISVHHPQGNTRH